MSPTPCCLFSALKTCSTNDHGHNPARLAGAILAFLLGLIPTGCGRKPREVVGPDIPNAGNPGIPTPQGQASILDESAEPDVAPPVAALKLEPVLFLEAPTLPENPRGFYYNIIHRELIR